MVKTYEKVFSNKCALLVISLQKGEIILVTSTNINGQWEGELNGKKGHFPFNFIKFIEEEIAVE